MKKLTLISAALFLFVGLAVPLSTQAQTGVALGPRLGIPVGDLGDASSVFFGADLRITGESLPVVPNASFDYYMTDSDNVSYMAIDLNALYEFGIDNQAFVPYAGGGIGITRSSFDAVSTGGGVTVSASGSDTDVGLNLVGGARFPVGSVQPFAQLNAVLGGTGQRLGLAGGLLFSF